MKNRRDYNQKDDERHRRPPCLPPGDDCKTASAFDDNRDDRKDLWQRQGLVGDVTDRVFEPVDLQEAREYERSGEQDAAQQRRPVILSIHGCLFQAKSKTMIRGDRYYQRSVNPATSTRDGAASLSRT